MCSDICCLFRRKDWDVNELNYKAVYYINDFSEDKIIVHYYHLPSYNTRIIKSNPFFTSNLFLWRSNHFDIKYTEMAFQNCSLGNFVLIQNFTIWVFKLINWLFDFIYFRKCVFITILDFISNDSGREGTLGYLLH